MTLPCIGGLSPVAAEKHRADNIMARSVTTKEIVVRYKADTSDFTRALKNIDKSAAQTAQSVKRMEASINSMFRVIRNVTVLYYLGKNLIDLGKAFTSTVDAIKAFQLQANALSESTTGFNQMVESANRARVSLADMGKQVNIFTPALKKMGVSFEGSLAFIENLTKSMRLYGVQGEAARNSTIQLAQAFSSGRLQGDELRSISENAGGLYAKLETVIQGMLDTETSLRDLGTEGKLSAATLLEAFDKLFVDIQSGFESLPKTVAQSTAVMNTEFSLLSSAINEAFDVNPAIVEVIELITEGVKALRVSMGEYAGLEIKELFAEEARVAKELAAAENKLAQAKLELEKAALADQEAFFSFGIILKATGKNLVYAQREVESLSAQSEELEGTTRDTAAALLDTGDAAVNVGDAMNSAVYDLQAFADAMVDVTVNTNNALAELAAFRRGGLAALKVQKLIGAEEAYAAKNASLPEAEREKLLGEYRTGVVAEQQLQSEIAAARAAARAARSSGGGGGGRTRSGGGGGGAERATVDTSTQDLQRLTDRLQPIGKLTREFNEDLALMATTLGTTSEEYKNLSGILATEYVDALDAVTERNMPEEIDKQAAAFDSLYSAVASDFAGAFEDVALGTKSWSDALLDLESALLKAITQLLIIQPLMAAIKGGLSAAFPGLPALPGRAIGGPVAANQPYMVGERGPELFVPSNSGKIEANGTTRSEVNVAVNFNASVTGEGLRQSAAQIAAQVGAQTQRAIARNG